MKCCLCGGDAGEFGNNPAPLNKGLGVCCDECNWAYVIPARSAAILRALARLDDGAQ